MLLHVSLLGLIVHSGSCSCVKFGLENLLRHVLYPEEDCEDSLLCDTSLGIVILTNRECLCRKVVSSVPLNFLMGGREALVTGPCQKA